jgi:predicted DNA-binding protein with PD1-like motif
VAIESPQIYGSLKTNRHIMKDSSLSRRRCLQLSTLAGCSLILTGRGLKAQDTLPADYIRPGPITVLGKAPGLRSQLLSQGSSRTYAIIFGKYDEFMAGLTEFAENNQLKASHFTAIGAFHEALFGWFDGEKKAYKKIPITQQVEVISLVGDIGLVNGKPVVHAHGVVGLPDGTTRGGHIISATVWPTLELFLTDEPGSLVKEEDPDTGLFLFHPES